MTDKKGKNRRFAPILILSVLTFVALWFLSGKLKFSATGSENINILDSKWDIRVNGVTYENANLDEFVFTDLKRLDIIDMSYELGEEMNGGQTAEILVYLCSVEAYLDGERIYSYGLDDVWADKMVGSGYHFISLPEECAGKKLLIRMVINEDNAFTSIRPVRCVKTGKTLIDFSDRNAVIIFIDIFLLMLGFILTVIGFFSAVLNRSGFGLLSIGLFSAMMGLWAMCTNGIFTLFSIDRTFVTGLEYISLYLTPVTVGLVFLDMRKEESGWRKLLVVTGTTILVDFCVVAVILHATNSMRFPATLLWFQIIGFICVVMLLIGGILSVKNKSFSEKITTAGVIIVFIAVALDFARFNIQKYVFPNSQLLQNSFIPIGALLFVVLLVASYLAHLYDMVITNAEREALTRLAYHDPLTGLFNRAMSYDAFSRIEQNGDKATLISFDMNGLKTVNDSFGHDEGDQFLKRVAHILERSFEDVGDCYRIGGDEFLVIVSEAKRDELENALKKFLENTEKASEYSDYVISAAYGMATVGEAEDTSMHATMALADKRMYEMKATCENSRMAKEVAKKTETTETEVVEAEVETTEVESTEKEAVTDDSASAS